VVASLVAVPVKGWHHSLKKGVGQILNEDTLKLVYAAIEELNAQGADGILVEKNPDAPLLGGKKGIDSLAFVNLVVALEEQVQKTLHKSVVLVDEDSMALEEHPFRTVGTLANYLEKILDKK
jgi:D-alanine--poly(phosphoribitol) ligase subunit 2